MWKLIKIKSENIVSFRDMEFELPQEVATLIFGQNNDSEKQKNNGSGKSSFVEAVSFGITGEPMRKVNMDEIINDFAEMAWVWLYFVNGTSVFEIYREIFRDRAQTIKCKFNGETVVQASVNEYNKYILDVLGITKGELYSSYILSNNKYKSFFRASDKEKKEIINRYSNGLLVDESIEKLNADMEPVRQEANSQMRLVNIITGRVDAVNEQIANVTAQSEQKRLDREEKIKRLEVLISEKEQAIANERKQIRELKMHINSIANFEERMCDLEKTDCTLSDAYSVIKMNGVGIEISDYDTKAHQYISEIDACHDELKQWQQKLEQVNADLKEAETIHLKLKQNADNLVTNNQELSENENDEIVRFTTDNESYGREIEKIKADIKDCEAVETSVARRIAELKNILHGAITCPKCSYRFLLHSEISYDDAVKEMDKCQDKIKMTTQKREHLTGEQYDAECVRANISKELNSIYVERERRLAKVSAAQNDEFDARTKLERLSSSVTVYKAKLEDISATIKHKTESVNSLKKQMFDELFDAIDSAIYKAENAIKAHTGTIEAAITSLEMHKKSVDEVRKMIESDETFSLKETLVRYQNDLIDAQREYDKTSAHLNELMGQLQHFVEFKGYLANTKIKAIAQITNSFLEQIGSNLRVELSGYKLLKSGKVRENISIKVLRDGIDCGSFDKLSGGERARVCLANILAMHSLTNLNCDERGGLDMLIIDEVLDCSDESGIASYCEVFNKLGITSMIITQGLVSESYPYKLLVVKENGVSSIIK